MPIEMVEDHIITKTKALFSNKLKTVEALPSAINVGVLKAILATAPSVYLAFLGGTKGRDDGDGAKINGRFDVYIVTRHVGNFEARRRGDATTIGAYDIIKHLVPELHGSVVTDIGTLALVNIKNLFSMQLEQKYKAAMYALTFEVPNMPFDYAADMDALDDFMTFDGQYDIEPHQTTEEHQNWLQEPPNHASSEPDLNDQLTDLDQQE